MSGLVRVDRVLKFLNRVGVRKPVIAAPMPMVASPRLVAGVGNSGAIGTLSGGYRPPAYIKRQIQEVRDATHAPYIVSLCVPPKPQELDRLQERVSKAKELLAPVRSELGLAPLEDIPSFTEKDLKAQVKVITETETPIVSFKYGVPSEEIMASLKKNHTVIFGTATTVAEAKVLEDAGVDAIIAQGYEAHGPRATFLPTLRRTGTMTLVPSIVDEVKVPVIASGGIMDGRGVVSAFSLGAVCVEMGTAFLVCEESGAPESYKKRVMQAKHFEDDALMRWSALSGTKTRGFHGELTESLAELEDELPEFPMMHWLTADIRRKAAELGDDRYMAMWAGQGARLVQDIHFKSADDIISMLGKTSLNIMQEIEEIYQAVVRLRKPDPESTKVRGAAARRKR